MNGPAASGTECSGLHTFRRKTKRSAPRRRTSLADYRKRLDERIATFNTHDLGFLYILSAKAQYLITGNEEAKDTVLLALDL